MKIKFFNPNALEKNLKATVHRTGKLGFTIESAKKMNLENSKSLSIGTNEDDENDKSLYIIVNENTEESSFPVLKAGQYHYINTKALFDNLNWDYLSKTISFDIKTIENDGQAVYKFEMREKLKKQNELTQNL